VSSKNFNRRLNHIKNSLDPNVVRRKGVVDSVTQLKAAMSSEKIKDGTYAKTVIRFLLEARDARKNKDVASISSIMAKESEIFSKYLDFDYNGYKVNFRAIKQEEEQIRQDEGVQKYYYVIAQNMKKVTRTQKELRIRNAKIPSQEKVPQVDEAKHVKMFSNKPGKVYSSKRLISQNGKIADVVMHEYMRKNGVEIEVAKTKTEKRVDLGSLNDSEVIPQESEINSGTEIQAAEMIFTGNTDAEDIKSIEEQKTIGVEHNNQLALIPKESILQKIGKRIAKLGESVKKTIFGKKGDKKENTNEDTIKTNPASWLNRTETTPIVTEQRLGTESEKRLQDVEGVRADDEFGEH